MRYFGKTLHPEYTDLVVVLGPNARWVECDYEDLMEYAPEVLLGYRVRLATPQTNLRGFRIEKLVILDGLYGHPRGSAAAKEAYFSTAGAHFPKVEMYEINRGHDPVVTRLEGIFF